MDKKVHYGRFVFVGSVNHRYDFSNFLNLRDFFDKFFSDDISLNDAKYEQRSFHQMIWKLDDYSPAKRKYEIKKENALSNVKFFTKTGETLLLGLKKVNINCRKNMRWISLLLVKVKKMHQSFCLKIE